MSGRSGLEGSAPAGRFPALGAEGQRLRILEWNSWRACRAMRAPRVLPLESSCFGLGDTQMHRKGRLKGPLLPLQKTVVKLKKNPVSI